jgi:hypothetical protein
MLQFLHGVNTPYYIYVKKSGYPLFGYIFPYGYTYLHQFWNDDRGELRHLIAPNDLSTPIKLWQPPENWFINLTGEPFVLAY